MILLVHEAWIDSVYRQFELDRNEPRLLSRSRNSSCMRHHLFQRVVTLKWAISELVLPLFQNESWCCTCHLGIIVSCTVTVLQINPILIWKVIYQDSLQKRGIKKLENGSMRSSSYMKLELPRRIVSLNIDYIERITICWFCPLNAFRIIFFNCVAVQAKNNIFHHIFTLFTCPRSICWELVRILCEVSRWDWQAIKVWKKEAGYCRN